jgi:hypothetical protein
MDTLTSIAFRMCARSRRSILENKYSSIKSIHDYIINVGRLHEENPLELIQILLQRKPKKEQAIVSIDSGISAFENIRDRHLEEFNKYLEAHPDRVDEKSADRVRNSWDREISLLKEALIIVNKKGVRGLRKWLVEENIKRGKRKEYYSSISPSMKNINEIEFDKEKKIEVVDSNKYND